MHDQRFERLRQRYAQSLPAKQRDLVRAWQAFVDAPQRDAARQELQSQVHRLCGSAPAYGYERLGTRARVTEHMLSAWAALPAPLRDPPQALAQRLGASIAALIEELGDAAARHAGDGPPATT